MTRDTVLGGLVLVFGLFVVFVWAPLDAETGIALKVRGRWAIGDAAAPIVAGVLLLVAGAWLLVTGVRCGIGSAGPAAPSEVSSPGALTLRNLRFLTAVIGCVAASLAIMRFAGPLAADLTVGDYRPLRDEVPWKYIGFVAGGGFMIFSLIALVERRLDPARLLLAFIIALVLALVCDLPFEDLLLPPNGDV